MSNKKVIAQVASATARASSIQEFFAKVSEI
jgi:alpha-D-ribose 1-methylphosphonate 5-phosphate C-P lyase